MSLVLRGLRENTHELSLRVRTLGVVPQQFSQPTNPSATPCFFVKFALYGQSETLRVIGSERQGMGMELLSTAIRNDNTAAFFR